MSLAAAPFCKASQAGRNIPPETRRVVRGRLTGTREFQQVITWRTAVDSAFGQVVRAHMAIETASGHSALWQADERIPAVGINMVRIADLDGDGLPEVIGLWQQGGSGGSALRVFHWDPGSSSFAELLAKPGESGLLGIRGYRLAGRVGNQRVIVQKVTSTPHAVENVAFEVRGRELLRVRGGEPVSSTAASGIEGKAVISPVRPGPVREGESDSAPYKTTLVVWSASDGREVTRIDTGSNGRFRVVLPAGTYKVGPPQQVGRFLPRAAAEVITVKAGRFAHLELRFDSGMR